MGESQYAKGKSSSSSTLAKTISWQRPFHDPLYDPPDSDPDTQEQDIQTKEERLPQRPTFDLTSLRFGTPAPAYAAPLVQPSLQRQESEEEPDELQPQQIQMKLTVGQPGDRYEQEADAMAAQVMSMPEPTVQREVEETAEETEDAVQMKPLAAAITPLVQRQEIAEEEEPVQAKLIQREAIEEEEPIQTKLIQREEAIEDKEPIQTKLIQREEAIEEEDAVQTKLIQREEAIEEEDAVQTKLIQREAGVEEEEPVQTKLIQREVMAEDEEPLQAKAIATLQPKAGNKEIYRKAIAAPAPTADLESQLHNSKGGGSPLADDVQTFMGDRFGSDFSHVRVHTDASAVQMNKDLQAQAFTHGSDVYYGAGKSPGKNDLTAHELTHVVQQTGAKSLNRSSIALKARQNVLQTKISAAPGSVQRKSAPKSPHSDPGFQAVEKRTKDVAKQQEAHPPAKVKATEAQAAAVSPPNEKESKAQDRQVQEMSQQQAGKFDAAKFKAALMQKISAAAPSTLEEADKFKDGKQLEGVKRDASSQVGDEKKQAAAAIEGKAKEAPKTAGIPDKPVTPLPPSSPGAAPGDIGAAQAVPKPKDAAEVSMAEGSQSLDQQMASASVTEEQIGKSNEPEFKGALGAKKEAQADAATAPGEYRQKEQTTIAQAQTQAQATAQVQLQGMQGQKGQVLAQVAGTQTSTKGQDEQKRAEVSNHIQGIYNATKLEVEKLLNQLDGEVNQEFDRGANAAKQAFDSYVGQRMQRFKDERYSGPAGWAQWVIDKIKGPPPEVNGFYAEGRKLYLQSMDGALDRVANLVATKLNGAKAEIAKGRQDIQKYVAGLDPALRQVGQDAEQAINQKFDALEQSVDSKQDALIDSLVQKYNEKLEALDAEIEKKKEENKGLIDRAKDAIGETIKTILELKNMLMGMLAKAAGAVEKIIKDPIAFLGNLVAGIKQGFMGFVGNIATHLKKGLLGWLTGSLAGAGVEIPKSFDLKGIFALVTGLLGLTYQGMRDRVANKVGEKKVSALEKGFDMFILWKNEGAAGLWKFVQDKLTNLKEMVIGGIQSFVVESIINAGVTWVLSLLNPASAFVRACKVIIDVIMFFVERGSQIAELVNAVLDSVGAIADGAIGVAAKLVEGALAKALPVVIGFLASLVGLGGISGKIKGLIEKARGLVDSAVNWVLGKAIAFVKKLGGKLGFGKEKKDDKRTDDEKKRDLELALHEADSIARSKQPEKDVKASLAAIKVKYKMTLLEIVIDKHEAKEDIVHVHGEINPSLSFPPFTRPITGWKLASGGLKDHENKILLSGKAVHLFTRHGENVAEVDMENDLQQRLNSFISGQAALTKYYNAQCTSISQKIAQLKGQPSPNSERIEALNKQLKNNKDKHIYWKGINPQDRAAVAAASKTDEWRGKVANGPRKLFEANKTRFNNNKELEGAVLTTIKSNEENINVALTGNPTKEFKVTSVFSGNMGIGYELDASMNIVKLTTPLTKVSAIIRASDSAKQEYMVETAYPHA
jgi:hypothetical protein